MSRILSVVTPENVEVQFELAGLGSRFLAALLDYLIVYGTGALLVWGFMTASAVSSGSWFIGICLLLVFVVDWCYFIGFEGGRRGQTPGKRVMGLRVLRDGGFPLDMRSAILRNFLRTVDFLPSLYCVGTIAVFCSNDNKRLGDLAAGTVVIRERGLVSASNPEPVVVHQRDGNELSRLTDIEVSVLRAFLARSNTLSPAVRDSVGSDIASRLSNHLGIKITAPALPSVLSDYEQGA